MVTEGPDACRGGIVWDARTRSYVNAISNELYLLLLSRLHAAIPGDTEYRDRSLTQWEWFKRSGLINRASLVNDGLKKTRTACFNNNGTTWTYNQGVILGALTELHRATGDATLLVEARAIADSVTSSPSLSPNGILQDLCEPSNDCNKDQAAFKGIFVRYLGELNKAVVDSPYGAYLTAQAESAFSKDRGGVGGQLYGLNWAGPYKEATIGTQASAVSLLTAVLDLHLPG